MRILLGLAFVGLLSLAGLVAMSGGSGTAVGPQAVKVAFVGDQGLGANSVAVLQLIEDEGAHIALIQGDFDYANDPDAWDTQTTSVLGAGFPILASVGNHDVCCVADYAAKVTARVAANPDLSCAVADTIISKAHCTFRGLSIVITGPGVTGVGDSAYAPYIDSEFSSDTATWRICSWHKNQSLMQVGDKTNDTGWGVYEECLQSGAIVATGHDHSYSRTHLMSSFQNQTVASTSNTLDLSEGASFAFVSGLGGRSLHPQLLSGDWWASVYTPAQGANYGALFCAFFDTAANHASCYFKDIDGDVPDQFQIVTHVNEPAPTPTPTPTPVPPDAETDLDGTLDVVEMACGSDRLDPASLPERLDGASAAVDDDGDGDLNEALPPGSDSHDCDGDGWTGAQEMLIFESAGTTNDQDPCGNDGWPADLDPTNLLDIGDLGSFFFPLRGDGTFNKWNHPVPDPADADIGRWNLDQGGEGETSINIGDINALNPGVESPTSRPAMFGGQPTFFQSCPWPQ